RDTMSSSDENDRVSYQVIVNHLNERSGSKYRHTTKKTQSLIKATFDDGFTLDEFKQVIDVRTDEWMHDKKTKKYQRPETLFGTKLESYLNQPKIKKHENDLSDEELDVLPF